MRGKLPPAIIEQVQIVLDNSRSLIQSIFERVQLLNEAVKNSEITRAHLLARLKPLRPKIAEFLVLSKGAQSNV
jgi:hypothetical protein